MKAIFSEIFGFERAPSWGERVLLASYEGLIGLATLRIVWEWAPYLRNIKKVILPLGLAEWVDISFMFDEVLPRLNAVVITVCVVLGFMRWFRPAYAIAVVLFHLQYVSRYSLGEISHGSNIIGVALFGLGLGALLYREELAARRFGFGFSVLMTALGYSSAALCKLIATGPRWIDGDHLALWIAERSVDGFGKHGVLAINPLQGLLLEQRWLATITLAFGLLSEACGVLGLWRRLRPFSFGGLIVMHLGIWWSMDILFELNLYVLLVLGFPWDRWLEAARQYVVSSSATSERVTS